MDSKKAHPYLPVKLQQHWSLIIQYRTDPTLAPVSAHVVHLKWSVKMGYKLILKIA